MTLEERVEVIAAEAAAEIVVELYGSSLHLLASSDRVQYMGEITGHLRDCLLNDLEAAKDVIRVEQPAPSEWADRREFDRIVANFKGAT